MSASLPTTACPACVASAMQAIPFIQLCSASHQKWNQITDFLSQLDPGQKESACVVIGNDIKLLDYDRRTKSVCTKKQVLRVLRNRLDTMKPSHLKCPECDKKHSKVLELNKHIKDLKLRMCINCKRLFSVDDFVEHVRKIHKTTAFQCGMCKKIFRVEKRYLEHMPNCRRKYSRKGFICCTCEKSFPSDSNLNVHIASKHNPQICKGCDKKFTSWPCFQYHLKRCANAKSMQDKYICDYCSKEYNFKAALNTHIQYKHTVGKLLQCDKCGKKFSNPAHLREHDNTHNRIDDRYVCSICNAKYSTRRGYERHYKKHFDKQGKPTGYTLREKSNIHGCVICGQGFQLQKSLFRHLKQKHSILNWEEAHDYL